MTAREICDPDFGRKNFFNAFFVNQLLFLLIVKVRVLLGEFLSKEVLKTPYDCLTPDGVCLRRWRAGGKDFHVENHPFIIFLCLISHASRNRHLLQTFQQKIPLPAVLEGKIRRTCSLMSIGDLLGLALHNSRVHYQDIFTVYRRNFPCRLLGRCSRLVLLGPNFSIDIHSFRWKRKFLMTGRLSNFNFGKSASF